MRMLHRTNNKSLFRRHSRTTLLVVCVCVSLRIVFSLFEPRNYIVISTNYMAFVFRYQHGRRRMPAHKLQCENRKRERANHVLHGPARRQSLTVAGNAINITWIDSGTNAAENSQNINFTHLFAFNSLIYRSMKQVTAAIRHSKLIYGTSAYRYHHQYVNKSK